MSELDLKQFGKPTGKDGKAVLEEMNKHHLQLAEWALTTIPEMSPKDILDIGCGGGMLISLLSKKFKDSQIEGVDISEESVSMTKAVNSELVKFGRCSVSLCSVSDLPFKNSNFDLVTAFETYFFWPDLKNDMKEVARVTKPGGFVLVVSETYPHPDFVERNEKIVKDYGINVIENKEMTTLLEKYGFVVEIAEKEENNWVAFLGRKVNV